MHLTVRVGRFKTQSLAKLFLISDLEQRPHPFGLMHQRGAAGKKRISSSDP